MSRFKERRKRKKEKAEHANQADYLSDLCRLIKAGRVIPIISSAVFNDQIFDIDNDQILGVSPADEEVEDSTVEGLSIEDQLADVWAEDVEYPLPGGRWLPRVALYDRVINQKNDLLAKKSYLSWLKEFLLDVAADDPDIDEDTIEELGDEIEQGSFSDIAVELGYPKAAEGFSDPLQHLAKLELPIYITTSHYDFMERAILDNGRTPRTQICFWSKEPLTIDPLHKTDPDFVPSSETPLVYHLFGLETYPESMVLNEDDYLDFLAAISRDELQSERILPTYLPKALRQSSIILLGYRFRDWDFRVMFRWLINATSSSSEEFNLAIQLETPGQNQKASMEKIREYLEKYFDESDFELKWDSAHNFVEALWEAWDQWRR